MLLKEKPLTPFEGICSVTHWQGCCGKRKIEGERLKQNWGNVNITFSCVSQHTHFNDPHVVVVVLILFDPLLCTLHRLSHLSFHSPDVHLHLLCGLVR